MRVLSRRVECCVQGLATGSCGFSQSHVRRSAPLALARLPFHRISSDRIVLQMTRAGSLNTRVGASDSKSTTQQSPGFDSSLFLSVFMSAFAVQQLEVLSAFAQDASIQSSGPPASSYYVSLGLFLMTLPGLWSLIKRSPKAKIKRKTFEVAGPAVAGHMPLDTRARQIFNYFKNYNYTVKETGEVIVFEGNYRASVGQAAALVLYTAISLASTALVLSIAAPFGGNWWYLMCLISPAAGAYYLKNANRTEEFKVKMTTSDDDKTTDITVQGDEEEIDRFRKELELYEKGMEYVKGILE